MRIMMMNKEEEPCMCQVDGEILGTIPVKNSKEIISPKIDEVAKAFKNIFTIKDENDFI